MTDKAVLEYYVDTIGNSFGLNKEELCKTCKVQSKKTIYNWINGDSKPRKSALKRIFDLVSIADDWRGSGYIGTSNTLHSQVVDGSSLFDALCEDELDRDKILFIGTRLHMASVKLNNFKNPFS